MDDNLEIDGLGEERGAGTVTERGAEHEVPRNPGSRSVQVSTWELGYILSFPGYVFHI